jgi:SAM-dependent methyltransferase
MRAYELGHLIICAHIADRDLMQEVDPLGVVIATERFADLYDCRQSEATVVELIHRRSRQTIRLLDQFVFLVPVDISQENALFSDFFEHIAGDYENHIERACNLHNIDVLISLFARRLGKLHDLQVLDFGCGTGLSMIPVTAAGARVTGVDQSAGMRGIARARGMPVLTVDELVHRPSEFDAVIASYVFHLYPNARAIKAVCDSLKAGGVIVGNFHKGIGVDYMTDLFRQFHCEAFAHEATAEMERHGKYLSFLKG